MKFNVIARGDRTTGSGDHIAVIDIHESPCDAEYIALVKEKLGEAFKALFDAPHPKVFTDEEFAELTKDDT